MDSQTVSSIIGELKGIPSKDTLEQMLNEYTLLVKFKKLDGDERIMTCTKALSYIPEAFHPKNNNVRHNKNINVWDINAHGWRSFRYDRVISVGLYQELNK